MGVSHKLNCLKCSKNLYNNFGSGRFCSLHCSRSWSASQNSVEANKKRSESQKGKTGKPISSKNQQKMQIARLEKKLNKKVVIGDRWKSIHHQLDIDYKFLEEYRIKQIVCEICKKPESILNNKSNTARKLAIDHDHSTKKFRGLLCTKCNMNYDWFVENKLNILEYSNK